MAEHTKGEWRIDEVEPQSPAIVVGEGDDLRVIATLPYAYETEGWTDEDEANAHLIAAAPDLLEAAGQYIAAFYAYDVDSNNPRKAAVHMEAENNLKAAIAQARGEAPNG